jgi:hypothetical protein
LDALDPPGCGAAGAGGDAAVPGTGVAVPDTREVSAAGVAGSSFPPHPLKITIASRQARLKRAHRNVQGIIVFFSLKMSARRMERSRRAQGTWNTLECAMPPERHARSKT